MGQWRQGEESDGIPDRAAVIRSLVDDKRTAALWDPKLGQPVVRVFETEVQNHEMRVGALLLLPVVMRSG